MCPLRVQLSRLYKSDWPLGFMQLKHGSFCGLSGTGGNDTAGIMSLFLTHFDFIDQVGINSKAAPSEKSGMMLRFIPVDLKQEAHQDAGLPPPWPTGC